MVSLDKEFMCMALDEAQAAADEGEVPVGAVIVCNGEVIARAHNLTETNHSAIAHAELLAIDMACRRKASRRLADCTLYVTLEPCPMCAGAAVSARIPRVVYAAKDARAGACGSLINISAYPLECKPAFDVGLCGEESLALLRGFFADKRKSKN